MSTKSTGHKKELQLVLLGTTGSGRSATGNTILGEKLFKSTTSSQSVTILCQTETKNINGIDITVTDTPGWLCTKLSEEDVTCQLRDLNKNLKQPYAYLLVIRVGSFSQKEIDAVSKLEKVLGNSFLSRTAIVFSHSDDLEFKTMEEFISDGEEELQDLLQKCSKRYYFFNNRAERCANDMEKLIKSMMVVAKVSETTPNQPRIEHTGNDDGFGRTSHLQVFEDSPEKRRKSETTNIMVVGLKGSGKSSSIKNILKKFSHQEDGGCGEFTGERMKLVECPGFSMNRDEIEISIKNGLRVCEERPHVTMIVLSVDQLSADTNKMVEHVLEILDPNARKHVMILFTRYGELEDKNIEEMISKDEDMKTLVDLCDKRFCTLASREKTTESQEQRVLHMIDELQVSPVAE